MEKAQIYYVIGTKKEFLMNVMFNPTTYSIESGAVYQEIDVVNNNKIPSGKFIKPMARTLSVELFFDTINGSFDFLEDAVAAIAFGNKAKDLMSALGAKDMGKKKDITQFTDKLNLLLNTENDTKKPPITIFTWGGFTFTGVVTKLSQKNTMFLPNGIPVRTTVSISITEYENDKNASKSAVATPSAMDALKSAVSIDMAPVASAVLHALSFASSI